MSHTEPTGHGATIREIPPAKCANGHPLRPPNVQVFWGSPGDLTDRHVGARRGYRCWTCDAVVWSGE